MPNKKILILTIAASVTAAVVATLLMKLLGIDNPAVIGGGVSGGVSGAIAGSLILSRQKSEKPE